GLAHFTDALDLPADAQLLHLESDSARDQRRLGQLGQTRTHRQRAGAGVIAKRAWDHCAVNLFGAWLADALGTHWAQSWNYVTIFPDGTILQSKAIASYMTKPWAWTGRVAISAQVILNAVASDVARLVESPHSGQSTYRSSGLAVVACSNVIFPIPFLHACCLRSR